MKKMFFIVFCMLSIQANHGAITHGLIAPLLTEQNQNDVEALGKSALAQKEYFVFEEKFEIAAQQFLTSTAQNIIMNITGQEGAIGGSTYALNFIQNFEDGSQIFWRTTFIFEVIYKEGREALLNQTQDNIKLLAQNKAKALMLSYANQVVEKINGTNILDSLASAA